MKKRVKEGEVVVLPTNKSGNLAVMPRDVYLGAGFVHTRIDREVSWERLRKHREN